MKKTETIPEWLWDVLFSGMPRDCDLEVLRKTFLFNVIMSLGIISLLILGTVSFIQRNTVLGAGDFVFCSLLIGLFVFLRKRRKHALVSVIINVTAGLFFLFLTASGGVENTAYFWVFTYPFIAVFSLGFGLGTFASLILLGMAVTILVLGGDVDFFAVYSPNPVKTFIALYVVIYFIALITETGRGFIQNRLQELNLGLKESIEKLEETNREKEQLITDLEAAAQKIKSLQGILPICINCKRIRDDEEQWHPIEEYVRDHSEADFSHALCPECSEKLYPEFSRGNK